MSRSVWLKLGACVAIVIGLGLALRALGIDLSRLSPERVRVFVLSFGMWAPLIYVVAYGQPIVPLPASLMTITGGLAFGPVWGTCAAVVGATVRAISQFLVARLLGREAVAKLLKGKAAALDQTLGDNSFRAVLLIRLIPNFPYDMQNYTLGFSQVRFGAYALATLLGILPASVAFVYFGYSLTDPKQIWKLLIAVLCIATLSVVTSRWKRPKGRYQISHDI